MKHLLFFSVKKAYRLADVHQVSALYDLKEQSYRSLKMEVYNRNTGKPLATEKLPGVATIIGKGEKKITLFFSA